MSPGRPSFTTVICNYNYGRFVADAVASVLAQDYPSALRDVIVVDDGSTDDSRQVLRGFAGRNDVRIIQQDNAGQAAALLRGVAAASGDYVCLLDSDDLFRPAKLDRVARHLETTRRPGEDVVLFHDYAILDATRDAVLVPSWFASRGHRIPRADIDVPMDDVYVPIPCGQVYSRALLQRLAEGLPTPDHRSGADVAIGYGAFLLAGRIDYLHEVLGSYRVHGDNTFAAIAGDRWAPNFTTWHRWPRYLWYLEALLGTLQGTAGERVARLAFLKRLERNREAVSSRLRFRPPRLDIVVDVTGATATQAQATQAAVGAQVRVDLAVRIVGTAAELALLPAGGEPVVVPPDTPALARLAHGWRAGDGEFVAFIAAGERPDTTFGERLVHLLQHDVPALAACCDQRLVNAADVLLHAGVMVRSGAWDLRHVATPPFSSYLSEPVLPPLGAAVLRRSRFLDGLFAPAAVATAGVPDALAGWVLLLYVQALGPLRRLPQVLLTREIDDAIEVLPPGPHGGGPTDAERTAAARCLLSAYCAARDAFAGRYSEEWHAQFIAWLLHGLPPPAVTALRAIATAHGDDDSVALIDAVAELSAAAG